MKKQMGLMLPRLVPNPFDDGGRIFIDDKPLCMQLLLGTDDTHPGDFELSFRDR